jgi:hypothetical protein
MSAIPAIRSVSPCRRGRFLSAQSATMGPCLSDFPISRFFSVSQCLRGRFSPSAQSAAKGFGFSISAIFGNLGNSGNPSLFSVSPRLRGEAFAFPHPRRKVLPFLGPRLSLLVRGRFCLFKIWKILEILNSGQGILHIRKTRMHAGELILL